MEFNEKLQRLRKQENLTQEQLAEKLHVSRTAVSKWEGGKGYPSIDSLKAVSELFAVSIDELLSSDELITLARSEGRQSRGRVRNLAFGLIDLTVAGFIVLPLFSVKQGERFLSVPLTAYSSSLWIITLTYGFVLLQPAMGAMELMVQHSESGEGQRRMNGLSVLLNGLGILFFIATRQLYVATFLFLFIMVKMGLLVREGRMK